jgi:Ca-activated chloride channel family protein
MIPEWSQSLEAVRWARPEVLGLLLGLPLLLVWRWREQGRKQQRLGNVTLTPLAVQTRNRWPRWLAVEILLWVLLVLALAGPRWGRSEESGVAVGRDLILVVDLSRSMQAEDMADPQHRTRWQAARRAALELLETVEHRGGHRLGIVLFAARPLLLAPLTTDYDFLRTLLLEVDGEYPPVEVRPSPSDTVSGTRIGRALAAAVQAHDQRYPGYQDILLLSDGDDPGEDEEWREGIAAARTAGIPVHTVGLGDPDSPATLVLGEDFVQTRLNESVLKAIAEQTGGYYLPAHRQLPELGDFFRHYLEPLPSRLVADENLPLLQERYRGFVLAALLLCCLLWLRAR